MMELVIGVASVNAQEIIDMRIGQPILTSNERQEIFFLIISIMVNLTWTPNEHSSYRQFPEVSLTDDFYVFRNQTSVWNAWETLTRPHPSKICIHPGFHDYIDLHWYFLGSLSRETGNRNDFWLNEHFLMCCQPTWGISRGTIGDYQTQTCKSRCLQRISVWTMGKRSLSWRLLPNQGSSIWNIYKPLQIFKDNKINKVTYFQSETLLYIPCFIFMNALFQFM